MVRLVKGFGYVLLWILFLFNMHYYSWNIVYTAYDITTPIFYQPTTYLYQNNTVAVNDILFVEDYIIAQENEWVKDSNSRICPSGILSPYLPTINQIKLSRQSNVQQACLFLYFS